MRKRATPPSAPLEVSTRQPGCSSSSSHDDDDDDDDSSTPKQLTWRTRDTRSRKVTARRRARGARPLAHLDAVLERVPWQRQTFLLVDGLAENNQLLEEENPPLSGSGRDAVILLADEEGVLLEQLPLGGDLALGREDAQQSMGNTPSPPPPPAFASTKILKQIETQKSHFETLKSAHVHHVVATFRHKAHHLHGSLVETLAHAVRQCRHPNKRINDLIGAH